LIIADGFGSEIFDFSVLKSIEGRFAEPRYREHLTSAYWEHQNLFDVQWLAPDAALADQGFRFDVDTPEDLRFLQSLVRGGRITMASTAYEIMDVARVA
jgi:spore coat polysaccharide biosynthesis protein SpsF (cytidylyltransferase family)